MAPPVATAVVQPAAEERYYIASQWRLMWRKFRKHRLAIGGSAILALFYLVAAFAEFFAVDDPFQRNEFVFAPPQRIHFVDAGGAFPSAAVRLRLGEADRSGHPGADLHR